MCLVHRNPDRRREPLATTQGKRLTRVLFRPYLDWSEPRPHLAGAVCAAICTYSLTRLRRIDGIRAVTITPKGRQVSRLRSGARLG